MENYEEKYKQALKRAKTILELTDNPKEANGYVFTIFPELCESEDEKIRKGLIKGLSAMRDIHKHQTFSDDAIDINDAIAWLEKQGKQKPADKVEPKFKVGDIIKYVGEREEFSKEKHTIKEILDDCYLTIDDVYIPFKFEEYYIHINQNQPWSEEDEKIRTLLIDILKVNHPNDIFKVNPIGTVGMEAMSTEELVDWLKSLKPNHWKPSEGQMEALKKRTHGLHTSSETRKALESLYNDLLKL